MGGHLEKGVTTLRKTPIAIVLLPAVMQIVCPSAHAQMETRGGPKVGIAFAKFVGGEVQNCGTRNTSEGGVFVRVQAGPHNFIQAELLYRQKGAEIERVLNSFGSRWLEKITYRIAYLEVPVLMCVIIATRGQVEPALYLGPYAGYKIGSSVVHEGREGRNEFDVFGASNGDFGIVVGAGVDIGRRAPKVVLDGRYTLGISSVFRGGADIRNSVLSFSVGVML